MDKSKERRKERKKERKEGKIKKYKLRGLKRNARKVSGT
jgi:hypothetical protein